MNHGLANISLILGLVLLILAVPVAVLLVQQNQNTQNRAYVTGPTGSVDCTQILNAKIKYCSSVTVSSTGIPCSEIDSAIANFCVDDSIPAVTPTFKPIPTSNNQCTQDQNRCAGRILFRCINNQWILQKTCPVNCLNGVCVTQIPTINRPPIKSFVN